MVAPIERGSVREVTPEMYGAVGDGRTDDTVAINEAAEAARHYGIPFHFSSDYYVTDTLNFTGTPGGWYGYGVFRGNHGWNVYGDGQYVTNIYANLDSAFPVFDFTGTQNLYFHDIHISVNPDGLQTAGVLTAMDGENNRGMSPHLSRLQVDGIYSKVGVANISADISELNNCWVSAPVGLFYGETDVLEVGSKYRTFTSLRHQNTQHNIISGAINGMESSTILVDTMGGSLVAYGSVISLAGSAQSAIRVQGGSPGSIFWHGCRTECLSSEQNTYILDAVKAPQYSHFSGAYHVNGIGPFFHIPSGQTLYNSFIQIYAGLNNSTPNEALLLGGGGGFKHCVIYDGTGINAEVGGGTRNNTVYSINSEPWENFIVGHVMNIWHGGGKILIGGDLYVSRDIYAHGQKVN